jgi:hypothetical protein
MSADAAADKLKDGWDRADILLKGLLPLAVAGVGYFGTSYLASRQGDEATTQFYTGLLARREEADSNLRKEMFRYVIDNFLGNPQADPHKKVLGLEMLAVNFHDSFDLSPLFKDAHQSLQRMDDTARAKPLIAQLVNTSKEIADRQIASLADPDHRWDFEISSIDGLLAGDRASEELLRRELKPLSHAADDSHPKPTLIISASAVDTTRQAVRLRIAVLRADAPEPLVERDYWISFFDFPALNSLRLPNRERVAVALRYFDGHTAQLQVVHFPETRASLKEKPYFDDLINDLKNRTKG